MKLVFSALMMLFFLLACAPKASSPQAPVFTSAPITAPRAAWEVEWEKTLAASRKEGKVVIYTGPRSKDEQLEVQKALNKAYGLDLSLEWVVGRSEEQISKLLAERRAGLFLADIIFGGGTLLESPKQAGMLDNLKLQLVLPEVLDLKLWWQNRLPFLDKDNTVIAMGASPQHAISINTNLVKEKEIKSYHDLLDPRWKGKIVMDDPTIGGAANIWFTANLGRKVLGTDFMRQMAKMDVTILRDKRLSVDWLGRGKFSIGLGLSMGRVIEFIEVGAPLELITSIAEPVAVGSGGGNFALINKAPHPDAARVFINWQLTREGHTIYNNGTGYHTTRLDVPTSGIPRYMVRQEGVDYLETLSEEFNAVIRPEQTKIAQEIFGPLMR